MEIKDQMKEIITTLQDIAELEKCYGVEGGLLKLLDLVEKIELKGSEES